MDVTAHYSVKRNALAAFESQFHRPPATRFRHPFRTPVSSSIEARDRYFGGLIGASFGEAFLDRGPVAVSGAASLIPETSRLLINWSRPRRSALASRSRNEEETMLEYHRRRRVTQRCEASATGPLGSGGGRLRQRCSSSTMQSGIASSSRLGAAVRRSERGQIQFFSSLLTMKIGITCYPTEGGSGVVATELGKQLARRGHEIHFITSSIPVRLRCFEPNIYFHEVRPENYPVFLYPPYCLSLAARWPRWRKRTAWMCFTPITPCRTPQARISPSRCCVRAVSAP